MPEDGLLLKKPNLTDNIINVKDLPQGTKIVDITKYKQPNADDFDKNVIDTNIPGNYVGKVEVQYPDGSKDIVDVPLRVREKKTAQTPETKVEGTAIEVEPNEKEQKTGLKLINPDETTEVSAKDANGNNVDITYDEDTGDIIVTPAKDVKGPLTVTIKDDHFVAQDNPTGEKTFTVPVKASNSFPAPEQSAKPNITAPKAGAKTISGTGVPGAKVSITKENQNGSGQGAEIARNVEVQQDGSWIVNVPDNVTLVEGDAIYAIQQENNKTVSEQAEATVTAADTTSSKTKVTGTPSTVKADGSQQDTGLKIENLDNTTPTTVEATDEDSNNVPVQIAADGSIKITPDTNTDGPITVTVKDGDFAQDMIFEIPVEGYLKGVDDNHSGKPTTGNDTSVDDSQLHPVKSTDDAQDTGVVVRKKIMILLFPLKIKATTQCLLKSTATERSL